MDALAFLLMDSAKKVKKKLTHSLKPYNITCRQSIVLRTLAHQPLSAKSISMKTATDKATLSSILTKLIEHEFVTCTINVDDKRENAYTISKKGADMLPLISDIEDHCKKQLTAQLSQEEYDTLIMLIKKLKKMDDELG